MTASTAPTQPPDKCPACGASPNSEYDARRYTTFECGLTLNNETGKYLLGHNCTRAFSAAIQKDIQIKGLQAMREADHEQLAALRAERDAALARALQSETQAESLLDENIRLLKVVGDYTNLASSLTARVGELQAVVDAARKYIDLYQQPNLIPWQVEEARHELRSAVAAVREGSE